MTTCSCGYQDFTHGNWRWASKFCEHCGDRLLPGGTVEPRAELERDKARLDKLDSHTIFAPAQCGFEEGHYALWQWHPDYPWDFGLDEKTISVLRRSRSAARDLADALPEEEEE